MLAYIGTRTTRERNARGEGIGVFRMLPRGGLERIQLVEGLTNPSYLALNGKSGKKAEMYQMWLQYNSGRHQGARHENAAAGCRCTGLSSLHAQDRSRSHEAVGTAG